METNKWSLPASAAFNIAAAVFLICALIPAYIDAKRYRKTFFLEEKFFKFFFFGATAMWLNAIAFIFKTSWKYESASKDLATLIMFVSFFFSNSVSMFVNWYSWKVKRDNMSGAREKGISEQEYWEKYVAPTLNLD